MVKVVTRKPVVTIDDECCTPSLLSVPLAERAAADLARAFAALSDPVRLRCLSLIAAAGVSPKPRVRTPAGVVWTASTPTRGRDMHAAFLRGTARRGPGRYIVDMSGRLAAGFTPPRG